MSFDIVPTNHNLQKTTHDSEREFVTMEVAGQLFGISVYSVRDVLAPQKITYIPLSPVEVTGSLNLRGRIVTAIDIRKILGLPAAEDIKKCMSVVVEHNDELYSLIVDMVGEVLSLSISDFSHNPENLARSWLDVSLGIYPLKNRLLVIIDVNKLLQVVSNEG